MIVSEQRWTWIHIYPLSNLIRPRCAERAKPGRGKPVLIMHIGFFACFHAISLERSRFRKSPMPISRLVACSARTVVDRQAHRTTTVIPIVVNDDSCGVHSRPYHS